MTKKRLYQLLELLLLLVGLLIFAIVGGLIWGSIKDEASLTPCQSGEGAIAGMPCSETTPVREAE